jgi:hypothetical protein
MLALVLSAVYCTHQKGINGAAGFAADGLAGPLIENEWTLFVAAFGRSVDESTVQMVA